MPTRTYYFPLDFKHLEEILQAETSDSIEAELEYFRRKGIAPLLSEGNLPLFLGISPKVIFSIRKNTNKHYRNFIIKKRDGSDRQIETPRTYLKVIQWWILDNILNRITIRDNVFGFVKGRNPLQNAEYHLGSKHILNVDIENFFNSINIDKVRKIYVNIGYSEQIANMMAELCCLNGRVPQGAPTSPAIANMVLQDLDSELSKLAINFKCKYSRYADDITFSSRKKIGNDLLNHIEKSVNNEGFRLKISKTRFAGPGNRMEVTGIVINEKMQPPRTWRKNTRAHLHTLSTQPRLRRKDVSYLNGIIGMAIQYPESDHMSQLAEKSREILRDKLETVVGFGLNPALPNGLTIRQAEALASLSEKRKNLDIAIYYNVTESAIKKRLQEAYKKIGATERSEAIHWAKNNL